MIYILLVLPLHQALLNAVSYALEESEAKATGAVSSLSNMLCAVVFQGEYVTLHKFPTELGWAES